ncbi:MAG: DctP family TRAP transporter solute-binding subunit [Desulfuromonadales bacterium]|nr:DctP family TRAP transporter solute-binding subunit [Desulfuromonadales bacterium]
MIKKTLALCVALMLCIALAAVPTPAEAAKSLKLAHLNNEDPFDNATGAMAAVFKNLVEAGTNGSVKVEIFPSGQLGKDSEVLQQVKAGVVQSTIATSGGMASIYPLIGVLDIPFAFPNISATYAVFDGPFGDKMAADINAKTGLKVLGFGDSGGFFAFSNSKRPIKTPADMKGLKIRTMGLQTHKTLVSSLGGQPVSLPWAEVYTSLQTGVADGQMNPIPIIKFAKFDEVQKYLTLSGHLFAPYPWVINQKFYDSLSQEEQEVVNYAAESAIVAGRGISRIIEASDRGLPALAQKMEIYSPTPEEKAMFREAAAPAVKQYVIESLGKEGEEMLNAFLTAVDAAN